MSGDGIEASEELLCPEPQSKPRLHDSSREQEKTEPARAIPGSDNAKRVMPVHGLPSSSILMEI